MFLGFGLLSGSSVSLILHMIYGESLVFVAPFFILFWGIICRMIGYSLDVAIIVVVCIKAKKYGIRTLFIWAIILSGVIGLGLILFFIVRTRRKDKKKLIHDYKMVQETERQESYDISKEEWNGSAKEREQIYQELEIKYNKQIKRKDEGELRLLISGLISIGDYKEAMKMLDDLFNPITKPDGNIICPLCDTVQHPNRKSCYFCEIPFRQ